MSSQEELIKEKIYQLQAPFLTALKRVMRIPSVKGPALEDAPFGSQPKAAIVEALNIAEELGFQTKLVNNGMGYVQYGEESTYVGVIGHLDVVAAGSNWHYPPFDLTIDKGIAYGRGILDNKGPIMSCLYGLYVLKELKLPLKKTIRIVFGSDEESGSKDIPLYLAEEKPPIFGFTPDCKYPAVYGERGILGIKLTKRFFGTQLSEIMRVTGNFDSSSVPDLVKLEWTNGCVTTVSGKRAPSNAPTLGLNGITLLAQRLNKEKSIKNVELQQYFSWLEESLHEKHNGEGLGIDFSDQESGDLQLTPVNFNIDEEGIVLQLSIRYPISVKEETVLTTLREHLPAGVHLVVTRSLPSACFSKNHPMLTVMQEVYESVTGQDGTPVTTTGATYARSMPNIIAFGPSFPGQQGIAHNHDEYMTITDLMTNMEIYTLTLARLAQ